MSKGSIRLHPKRGLNPTMPVCNWCGQPTGEIALLGAAYKGEAPSHMVINDEPCAKCREQMAKGITFIEREREGRGKRTGRWCVLKEEAVRYILKPGSFLNEVLEKRACNVDPTTANAMRLFDHSTEK